MAGTPVKLEKLFTKGDKIYQNKCYEHFNFIFVCLFLLLYKWLNSILKIYLIKKSPDTVRIIGVTVSIHFFSFLERELKILTQTFLIGSKICFLGQTSY